MSKKQKSPQMGTDTSKVEAVKSAKAMGRKIPRQTRAEAGAPPERAEERQGDNDLIAVVGVGASAGGLEAFSKLVERLPADTGMAFVLVMRLDPKHESILPELLARSASLPVSEANEGTLVAPNHIYVTPRNTSLAIEGGALRLQSRRKGRVRRRPIDAFLQSLAEDQDARAIGVILSGAGADGVVGLETIKAQGGITFAQEPKSAGYDSMPRRAIAAGCVDFTLTPEEIAEELARISRHPHVAPAAVAERGAEEAPQLAVRDGLHRILALLRRASGVDFSPYKANTLRRRIMRRMILNKLESLDEYAKYLRHNPAEVENLYQDILINVTSFFRDPESFEVLKEKVFPRIVARRDRDEPVRIWVVGCSTGEEAYSIAMAFTEFASKLSERVPAQIFATDINERAIEKARAGLYPKNVTEDVSPERLSRFFTEAEGGYRVSKALRDVCVFARQDVINDPPFPRMDLIACRNLLIYMEPALQKQILSRIHYALKPEGVLWLGHPETTGAAPDLFEPEDEKRRFYVSKPATSRPGVAYPASAQARVRDVVHRPAVVAMRAPATSAEAEARRESDRIILARFSPACALVNEEMSVLQLRGDISPYLDQSPVKKTRNLLKMAREGLLVPLREAVDHARRDENPVRKENLSVKYDGLTGGVSFEVIPLRRSASQERFFLILFETSEAANRSDNPKTVDGRRKSDESRIKRLTQELAAARDYLQSVIEEYEATNEELQAANEEVQSSNEELQSVNEELEISREEIESSNEELITLNEELNDRNEELGRLNSDLVNLLGGVQMPILMLDNQLRIRHFTPAAGRLLNLIPSDVGRLFGDLKLNLDCPDLERLIAGVIDTVTAKEIETRDGDGRWHSLRVYPYKTFENRVGGAMVTLVDIDALKKNEMETQAARDYAEAILRTTRDPLIVLNADLRAVSANDAFYKTFKVRPAEIEGRLIYELSEHQWDIPRLRRLLEEIIPRDNAFNDFDVTHEFPGIGRRTMLLNARRLINPNGGPERILLGIEDVTERKRAEEAIRVAYEQESAARAEAEEANRLKDEFLATISHELRSPLNSILGWAKMLKGRRLDEDESVRALDVIYKSAKAQNQLIGDLLDVSRIITGKSRLDVRMVEPAPIIEAAMDIVRPAADAKKINLVPSLDPAAGPVLGDADRLQQVVWNLLSNAVKFTPAGGEVAVSLERDGANVTITVSDTGEGIEPKFLPFVFDRFRQFEGGTTRAAGGLGLGLAIVRHLVELHGGVVSAASGGRGKGATFTVTLPLASTRDEALGAERDHMAEAGETSQSHATPPDLLRDLRVLLVDDEEDARELIGLMLGSYEAEVKSCASAAEALRALDEWLPDVMVSDIGMPAEDGYDLIKKTRAREPDRGGLIPALALTAYARPEDAQRALDAGYQAHISKPVDPSELAKAVASVAGRGGGV